MGTYLELSSMTAMGAQRRIRSLAAGLFTAAVLLIAPGAQGRAAADQPRPTQIEERLVFLPLPIPVLAFVARPLIDGPLKLVVMNHGESLDPTARSFIPIVEFREAALWFAKQGNLVVVPVRPGFGAAALSLPDEGVFSAYLGTVGKCSEANFRNPGLAVAAVDQWVIDYFIEQKLSASEGVVVVGQSGGGWGAIALSSKNNKAISAIVTFAAGRGGRVDGKPNNNCAPDKLVDTAREFGRTARTPMLWIYIKNDTFFGPELSQRLFEAYTGAGGKAEYHLMPDFGEEGHAFFGSPETIPIWSPLVTRFLATHR